MGCAYVELGRGSPPRFVSTGRMKSGVTDIPIADSVSSQADCTARKNGSTQSVSRLLPERPCSVTAKGWPLFVVFVCQQTPRRLVLVRERLLKRIRCRSPNLRPPWRASRRPPRKSRRSCGQCGLLMYFSHSTTTRKRQRQGLLPICGRLGKKGSDEAGLQKRL